MAVLLLGGCSVGPNYRTPAAQVPSAYKEAGNWTLPNPMTKTLVVIGGPYFKILSLMRSSCRSMYRIRI